MPQTALTPVTLKQNNYAVVAGDLVVTPVVMDAVNGNSFIATGQEILLFQNTDSAAHTITISSVTDALGRSDTSLTAYSIAAAGIAMIQMKTLVGWVVGGLVDLATSSALVKISVVRYQ
jgi:hypothetical protein